MKKPYAIIQLQGKQHIVTVGDLLTVDRLDLAPAAKLEIKDVLLYADEKEAKIGTPTIAKATVTLEAVENKRGVKIHVATFKAKSRYHKTKGHRQELTVVKVVSIEA